MKNPVAEKLLDFMKNSPTRYQVVANFEQRLNDAGYTKLYPEKVWQLENGGKYYLSPNGTAIMAFRINYSTVTLTTYYSTYLLHHSGDIDLSHSGCRIVSTMTLCYISQGSC